MIKKIINKIKNLITHYYLKKKDDFRQKECNRLTYSYKKYEKIKLHIGCGPRILKGWINIDLKYEPFENYLKYYQDKYLENIRGTKEDFWECDVTKGISLPDNCVDVIFSEDFIEHLSQRGQVIFLSEALRVMKKDAVHRINTPDLLQSMHSSNFKLGIKGVYLEEWDKNGHINVLSKSMLKELVKMVGYSRVVFNTKNRSISELIPEEYRPDIKDRPLNGNIFVDLIK